jgi:hypothetical protein
MRLVAMMRFLVFVAACRSCPSVPSTDLNAAPDLVSVLAGTCVRQPAAADHIRKVVVSHPFDASGRKDTRFEVLELTAAGALTRTNVTFNMGSAKDRAVHFTPDGEIGMVAQDDGSVGIFRFDSDGAVQVISAAFKDGFHATDVVPDATGAWVLDQNTDGNGGGLYRIDLTCDGTPSDRGRLIAGGKGYALAPPLYVAGLASGDIHSVTLGATPAVTASGNAFGDGMAIPSGVAIVGQHALVSDNGLWAGNRVAAISLSTLQQVMLIQTPNPAGVFASPFGDAALILNSDGVDALTLVHYDAAAQPPFTVVGPIAYVNGKPQLPSTAAVIDRGMLKGRTLVAENLAVRQLQFAAGGTLTDVGLLSFGSGLANIVGTVGVQP